MDDQAAKENPSTDFNKLDLSQLQSFSFGTQWTQDKQTDAAPERRERGDRPPRREDRRPGPGANPRPDRRAFRKPAGAPGDGPTGGAEAPATVDRRPRREHPQGGPRRDEGGERNFRQQGPRGDFNRGPYDSPHFAVTFYPEDTSFNALAKTIRGSCRTIELFEIARTVIAKEDRFVAVLARKPAADGSADKSPLYVSVPDGIPFESEEATIAHVISRHLGTFFDTSEVEVEAPKGNYQVINKCTVTGELLGPPNYHRYNQLVQQHHAARIKGMSLEAFRGRIETVRDPEVVNQWLGKMKKVTRYTWKQPAAAKPATPAADSAPADAAAPAETAESAPAAEAPAETAAPGFDSPEEARAYLLTQARDRVVRSYETVRFHGRICVDIPPGEIRRAIEGALDRQRRFPLDTANALRGRLRREHFTIFKKGSKGVSYVCAVKRKFRTPGQTFADSIGALIGFIEAHPMVRASELGAKFLGIELPQPVEGAAAPELPVESREKLARMQGDLRWLVTEGYVTEFIDGRLFAPPPMVEARKKEVENEEHDPENFPEAPAAEVPASEPAAAPAAEVAPEPETPPHTD